MIVNNPLLNAAGLVSGDKSEKNLYLPRKTKNFCTSQGSFHIPYRDYSVSVEEQLDASYLTGSLKEIIRFWYPVTDRLADVISSLRDFAGKWEDNIIPYLGRAVGAICWGIDTEVIVNDIAFSDRNAIANKLWQDTVIGCFNVNLIGELEPSEVTIANVKRTIGKWVNATEDIANDDFDLKKTYGFLYCIDPSYDIYNDDPIVILKRYFVDENEYYGTK